MKRFWFVCLPCLLVLGCASTWYGKGNYYKYSYTMIKPASADMKFEDANISIKFFISGKAVNFNLFNKTNKPIKVIWDNTSIVKFGEAKKTMHAGVKYIDRSEHQPPTIIPANSYIEDLLIPIDNIWYSSFNGWQKYGLFIDDDLGKEEFSNAALATKGAKLGVLLPIEIEGKIIDYEFEFMVTNVKAIPKSALKGKW